MRLPNFLKFARTDTPALVDTDPKSSPLWVEEATNQLVDLLIRIPETDDLLTSAGIHRSALSKLETDDDIFQALRTRREAVVATPWRLEGGADNAKEFIEEQLTPWIEILISGAWKAVPYGYSVMEVIYSQLPGRKIGIECIADKPIDWFDPRINGELRYFAPDGSMPMGVVLDQDFKFLLTRSSPSYNQPKGEALLSRLYWPWFFRFNGWKFWGQFLERFGTPLLVGKSQNPGTMIKALIGLHQDAAIAVGQQDDVKVEQPTASGEVFEKLEAAVTRRYQRLILGQTLTSDTGKNGGGSFALGKVHAEVKEGLKRADCRLVTRTIQRLVKALFVLNRFTGDVPEFSLSDDVGLEPARAERDKTLTELGLTFTRKYFTERYDLVADDFLLPGETLGPKGEIIPPAVESTKGGGNAVQDTALNGAQVSSLLEVITAVVDGTMPADTARAIIAAAFPEVGTELVDQMLSGLENFKPREPEPAPVKKGQKNPEEPLPGGTGAPEEGGMVPGGKNPLKASRSAYMASPGQKPQFSKGQEQIEHLADELLSFQHQPVDSEKIRQAVLAASDPGDLEHRLARLLQGSDRSTFQRALEQALFAADVIGYANADKKV